MSKRYDKKYKKHSIKWSDSRQVYHIWDENNIPDGYAQSIKECEKYIDGKIYRKNRKKDKS